jgi:hypothetical protein
VEVPSRLFAALISRGQLALVVGAGCSSEDPPAIPLATELARRGWRRLIDDGVLDPSVCPATDDLSELAQTVYDQLGHQGPLLERLGIAAMRTAKPNRGYLYAAALLIEGAIVDAVTLNFDLAMSTALATVGSAGRISILDGPEHFREVGTGNLIYIHRNANEPNLEKWILRLDQLEDAWRDGWEGVIAERVLATRVVVFAGLGSPAAVLTETIDRIRTRLGDEVEVFLVGRRPFAESSFAAALEIPEANYIQGAWSELMNQLTRRLALDYNAQMVMTCRELVEILGIRNESVEPAIDALCEMPLDHLGEFRGEVVMQRSAYVRLDNEMANEQVANLLLAIAMLERLTNATAKFSDRGVVEFHRDATLVGAARLLAGRGVVPRSAAARACRQDSPGIPLPLLACGLTGSADTVLPTDLARETPSDDIVRVSDPPIITVEDLRADETLAQKLVRAA